MGTTQEQVDSGGITPTERYLTALCRKSFLSLWSLSNIYRDQFSTKAKNEGKEICDVVVLFGDSVLLFSDKSTPFNIAKPYEVAWQRWHKRAVLESASQLWGAERWLTEQPHRVFLDRACTRRPPVAIPPPGRAKFYRIAVAHGARTAVAEEYGEDTGLVLVGAKSRPPGSDRPLPKFAVGDVDPSRGFVHVFDELGLDAVVGELDTIQDFIAYLDAKEALVRTGPLALAASERDLLAHYIKGRYRGPGKEFQDFANADILYVDGGAWENLLASAPYKGKKKADEISYIWDRIIEEFANHLKHGSLYYGDAGERGGTSTEEALRVMAAETRFRRRGLAEAQFGVVRTADESGKMFFRTLVPEAGHTTPAYVFLALPVEAGISSDEYRERRRIWLEGYLRLVAAKNLHLPWVVGLGTSPLSGATRSWDLVVARPADLTPEDLANAAKLAEETGLFGSELRRWKPDIKEFPVPRRMPLPRSIVQQVGRNDPCYCGSGTKFKKCCGAGR